MSNTDPTNDRGELRCSMSNTDPTNDWGEQVLDEQHRPHQ